MATAEDNFQQLLAAQQAKATPLFASSGGGMTSVGARPAATQNVRDTLDALVGQYVYDVAQRYAGPAAASTDFPRSSLPGSGPRKGGGAYRAANQAAAAEQQRQGYLDQALAGMYETVGGPNQALINALAAQKAQFLKNYEQNKANVTNLYGAISEEEGVRGTGLLGDIQAYGQELLGQYGTDITGMQEAATTRAEGITAQQTADAEKRARAAEKLGIAIETLQSPNQVDYSGIRAESDAASANWENLFTANKLIEQEAINAQLAGAGQSKIDHLTAMKNYLDQQNAAIDSQIAIERSKTATQQLTSLGKLMQSGMDEATMYQLQQMFPDMFGAPQAEKLDRYSQTNVDVINFFAKNRGVTYTPAQIEQMRTNINTYKSLEAKGGSIMAETKMPLTDDERTLMELTSY